MSKWKTTKNHKGMLGKKHSEETKKGMKHKHKKTGIVPITAFKKGYTPWNKGKKGKYHIWPNGRKMSEVMKKKIRKSLLDKTGKNARNWQGGKTNLQMIIRSCFKYRQWRSDIFTRDDFTCQDCGRRGGDLEAHHIKEFSTIIKENKIKTVQGALACEELWNINNGQTLCKECHNKTKRKVC